MADSFVIWGCAGHAKVLASLIKSQGGHVAAFFDNRRIASILPNVPIYLGVEGFCQWRSEIPDAAMMNALVAIGGSRGADRINIIKIFRESGLKLASLIHPSAVVCETAILGDGAQILAQAVVAAGSRLGEGCIINHKASVDHECVLGDGVHLAPGATLCGSVTIGNNVLVGAGAVILPRLNIGPNSIIGAGAVVTKSVPEGSVVVGNPARLYLR